MKKMAMLLAAGCAIGMLTGCGVPQEEVDLMIAEIETDCAAQIDVLNGTIADRDDVIRSEKAKGRQSRIELDDASDRIKGLQQKSAVTTKALATEKSAVANLESQLKISKSQTSAAKDDAMDADSKYNTLDVEYQELKRRFEMFQNNMGGSKPAAAPADDILDLGAPAAPAAPQSDAEKASSLLDQMGTL